MRVYCTLGKKKKRKEVIGSIPKTENKKRNR